MITESNYLVMLHAFWGKVEYWLKKLNLVEMFEKLKKMFFSFLALFV